MPFLQADKGHFHFLREGIFNNPDILETTKDFFSLIGKHLDEKKVLPLGEALEFCQDRMRERLTGKRISPNADFEEEVLHSAFFAFTAGYTAQWFSMEDLRTFGIPERFKDTDAYYWGPESVGRLVFPGYFATGQLDDLTLGENKNEGQDRSGHIVHHSFLGFELSYSAAHNLGLEINMPLFARILVGFGNNGTLIEKITRFSDRVGLFYEISKLISPSFWPILGRTPRTIADGVFDDTEPLDIKGNRVGVNFGIKLYQLVEGKRPINPLLQIIDNNFKQADDNPELTS